MGFYWGVHLARSKWAFAGAGIHQIKSPYQRRGAKPSIHLIKSPYERRVAKPSNLLGVSPTRYLLLMYDVYNIAKLYFWIFASAWSSREELTNYLLDFSSFMKFFIRWPCQMRFSISLADNNLMSNISVIFTKLSGAFLSYVQYLGFVRFFENLLSPTKNMIMTMFRDVYPSILFGESPDDALEDSLPLLIFFF